MNESEKGLYEGGHMMRFTEKRLHERLIEYYKLFKEDAADIFPLTAALWGFLYVLVEAMDNKVSIGGLALPVIITAVLVLLYKVWLKYKNYTPEVLHEESEAAKIIYRKQNCGWQFALAEQMLIDKISIIDLTLQRIKKGVEFIEPVNMTADEYYNWLELRPEALKRLNHVVMVQCTDEIPALLGDMDDSETKLRELKIKVSALIRLYEHTMKYEAECFQIVPREPFVDLHKMTYGWTEPIQRAINEFMEILHSLASIDRNLLKAGKVQPPHFNIIVRAPENIEEFSKRLDDISANLT